MSSKLRRHLGKLVFGALMAAGIWFWIARGDPSSSESGASRQKANLEVRVKDHRDAIADFRELEIIIDSIRLRPGSGSSWQIGWMVLQPIRQRVDLVKYIGTLSASVYKGEVVSGAFDGIDLKLQGIRATLKKNGSGATVKNLVSPIRLPFSVAKGNETLIILDFTVLDMSDHPPRGYELRLRGYELYKNGKLVERIPPA